MNSDCHIVVVRVVGVTARLVIGPPEQVEEVPHYLKYKARGLEKTIMVTMPGRRPVCPRCEQGVHRYSDCKKKEDNANV